jgi:hypothetical protein
MIRYGDGICVRSRTKVLQQTWMFLDDDDDDDDVVVVV